MALDRYKLEPFWKGKRLTPAQLLVHDVEFKAFRDGDEPRLDIDEVLSSNLIGREPEQVGDKSMPLDLEDLVPNRRECDNLKLIQNEYAWMKSLRIPDDDPRLCRWIHVSSKFPEYLRGIFLGLSNWNICPEAKISSLRQLSRCIYENERFSKHGRYFSPFFQSLADSREVPTEEDPILMSLPFLDWTTNPGEIPPNRFQVDPREQFYSSKSQCHSLRSILQHYYRLEDTSDRERDQVFSKHKPWSTDREIDLKVRRWYGKYPTGLNVDELWIMIIDSKHIVSFSSNQTWKSRWPPLQMPYRCAEVSFRNIRTNFFNAERKDEYTATTHAIACLHGSIGMIHRSFWSDVPLTITDRFSGYLGHLQYRLHRSPNTKLVMDLLQIQEELNIVLQLTTKQEEIVSELQRHIESVWAVESRSTSRRHSNGSSAKPSTEPAEDDDRLSPHSPKAYSTATYGLHLKPSRRDLKKSVPRKRLNTFLLPDPITELIDHVYRELDDLKELRDRSNELVNRTVQLVNIRLEDHGQAILVFTIVTIIFLPLSFVTSFFGMNVSDIRHMAGTQKLFWIVALTLTAGVVGGALILAFYGGKMMEKFIIWKENHSFGPKAKKPRPMYQPVGGTGFNVLDVSTSDGGVI